MLVIVNCVLTPSSPSAIPSPLSNIWKPILHLYQQYLAGRLLSDGLVANRGKSEFLRTYEIHELLGKGSFSHVHKVRLKEGGAELEAKRAKVNGSRGEGAQSEEKEFAAKKIRKDDKSKRVFDEVRGFCSVPVFLCLRRVNY